MTPKTTVFYRILTNRTLTLSIMTLVGLVACAASLVAEYAFHLRPCSLCLHQRYIHGAISVVGLMAFRLKDATANLLVVIVFLGSLGMSLYHAGVERHVLPAPAHCGGAIKTDDLEELRASLLSRSTVRCDKPALVIGGLSMADYNAILSALMVLFGLMAYRKQRHSGDAH